MKAVLLLTAATAWTSLFAEMAAAQAPTSLLPVRNALAVPRSATVSATLPRALSAGAVLTVFSQQAGGRKAGTATIAGNTVVFTPATGFKPGEQLTAVVTDGSVKYLWQFTAATGAGTGVFGGGSDTPVSQTSMVTGDIDGDGDLDAVVPTNGTALDLLLNDGTGALTQRSLSTGSNSVNVALLGDIDNDGDLDLLATRNTAVATRIFLLRNNNGTFTGPADIISSTNGSGIPAVALGDMDSDGDQDIVMQRGGTPQAEVLFNDGSGSFAGNVIITLPSDARRLQLHDLDNDGDLDVLAATSRGLSIRLNNGSAATFTAVPDVAETSYTGTIAVGDIDGDGDLDVIIPPFDYNGVIYVRLNNGNAAFAPATQLLAVPYATEVALGDVDNDGDLDILATAPGGNVGISRNNGTGSFSVASTLSVGQRSAQSLALVDMNNDGALDLVFGNYGQSSNQLSVRLNGTAAPTSTLDASAASFQLWPNPLGPGNALQLTLAAAAPTASYFLLNGLGQAVRAQTFSGQRTSISSAGLASGVYLLKVQVPGQLPVSRRVVVE
ncbi:T9SS type A sorting domain-containing protein [Hymenobacter gummosus]|uniref:T9SS type A sorting domain-containing protein n=1 Tax=Hymenobacter gummosus TaxID=1776032 RepID=A0A431U3U1_9BACT|nr:FG-GAP-like repeat-containing protein [Hymenobacter gummosus]RTQ50268.1 T9SS type A sorting domain-containing protein [Hymenobacter gummosus]